MGFLRMYNKRPHKISSAKMGKQTLPRCSLHRKQNWIEGSLKAFIQNPALKK